MNIFSEIEREDIVLHIRDLPYIWDLQHPHYKLVKKKEKAFDVIGRQYGKTGNQVKACWVGIREKYNRLISENNRRKPRSGAAGGRQPYHTAEWSLLPLLSFLRDVKNRRPTIETASRVSATVPGNTGRSQTTRHCLNLNLFESYGEEFLGPEMNHDHQNNEHQDNEDQDNFRHAFIDSNVAGNPGRGGRTLPLANDPPACTQPPIDGNPGEGRETVHVEDECRAGTQPQVDQNPDGGSGTFFTGNDPPAGAQIVDPAFPQATRTGQTRRSQASVTRTDQRSPGMAYSLYIATRLEKWSWQKQQRAMTAINQIIDRIECDNEEQDI
ncbi:hypothetical protein DMENIID0001_060530 [Sergentomyia squamirostris]